MEQRRVLIVDGKKDVSMALAALLERHRYHVFLQTNGLAALDIARAECPDALLLDVELPGLSGYEICRRARTESWGKDALIIAITGWTRQRDRRQAQAASFDHYLIKPVAFRTIDALLRGTRAASSRLKHAATDSKNNRYTSRGKST